MFTRICEKEQIPLGLESYLKKNQQNLKIYVLKALTDFLKIPVCALAGICIADSECLCPLLFIPQTL